MDLTAFDCASATVPLDWADPSGEAIQLAVVKHPAQDPARRLGTLFFNPGGPGGTGTGQFPLWYDLFPAEVRARYDIVSWDPRGVGSSTAVQCYDSAEEEGRNFGAFAEFPATEAEVQPYLDAVAPIGRACGARNGDLLAHVATSDTARDLDDLRRAVGEDRLTYWGVSYGTYLGATYANLFPGSVRALVLDGNLAPDAWTGGDAATTRTIDQRIGSTRGVAENVDAFLTLCGQATTEQCAFSAGSPEATKAKWTALLERLQANPYTAPSGSVITYQGLVGSVGNAMDIVRPLPGAQGWSGAATALQRIDEATAGSTSAPSSPAPAGSPASSAPSAPSGSSTAAPAAPEKYIGPEQTWSIVCSDSSGPPSSAWPDIAQRTADEYGPTSGSLVWGDAICADWPTRAAAPYTGPWDADFGATALLIGNTDDPSTPYANTDRMAQQLSRTATLTVQGYGHTMLLNPSSCGNEVATAYLIDGTLPGKDTVCPQDNPPFS